MALVDLSDRQIELAAVAVEQYAEPLTADQDLELLLELTLTRLDLLKAREQSLSADRRALRENYGV